MSESMRSISINIFQTLMSYKNTTHNFYFFLFAIVILFHSCRSARSITAPKNYHSFYDEEIDWVGYATKQGVADLEGKPTKINTGIYIPGLKSDAELKEAILLAKKNGATGVSFFDGNALSDSNLKTIAAVKSAL